MSVAFYGDYDTTETVDIPFNTFDSNDPTASVTITDLVAGDIEIHKDGGTTQRSSDAGVTISIDFDSVTGNHMAHIDLSDNTDAGFYAAGSRYQVRMEGTTVDAGTINAWIGSFSIGCTLRPTTAGRTIDITATGAAGIDWANVEGQGTAVDLSATAIDLCDDVTLVATTTTNTDMAGTDNAALASVCTEGRLAELDAGNLPTDIADIPTVAEFNARTLVAADYTIVADLGVVQTADHTAGIADIPTVAEFNARSLPSADYVVTTDTIAGVTLVATTTDVTNDVGITQAGADKAWGTAARTLTASTNFNDITAAEVVTAMEADGGDLSSLMEALVNKLLITEANGNAEMFNDAGVSQGTIAAAFASVAGVTQRKRMVI